MQRRTYYGGYYPYPPHYSYYPARTPPYQVPRKPLWPLALVLLGILLIAYGFISVPTHGSQKTTAAIILSG